MLIANFIFERILFSFKVTSFTKGIERIAEKFKLVSILVVTETIMMMVMMLVVKMMTIMTIMLIITLVHHTYTDHYNGTQSRSKAHCSIGEHSSRPW